MKMLSVDVHVNTKTYKDVGRDLWICTIHGSRCAVYGSQVRAGIHGSRRNLWIAQGSCLRDLPVLYTFMNSYNC